MRIGNEIKIGITVVLAIIVGFVGFRIMKDVPLFRQGTLLFAKYDRVDGLSVGTPIIISGIKIGSVQKLTLLPDDSVQVVLNINMIEGVPMGSVAYIRSIDILGSKGIEVERGPGSVFIPHNGRIKGVFDDGILGELMGKGSEITDNVTKTTERFNNILSEIEQLLVESGRRDIRQTLSNVESVSGQLDNLIRDTNEDVKASISNLRKMLENLEDMTSEERGELQRTLQNLEATTAELEVMSANLKTMSVDLAEVMKKINDGEGTLGLLVNDPSLYHNLDTLSVNLNNLIKNINDNPRHFLRHLRLIDVF